MKKILIFGIGGFVGAYLSKELSECGYEIYGSDVVDRCDLDTVKDYQKGNLTDSAEVLGIIQKFEPDAVVNLAAISSVGMSWNMPQTTMSVNVIGALNILEGLKKVNPKAVILLIGSSEEYKPSESPISEEYPTEANNPYGISKATLENFAGIYAEKFGMDIRFVRSFNHTGAGQRDNFVIPSWCKQAATISRSGKSGSMKVGNLSVKRDLSDVRDIVRAYRMILEKGEKGCMYNVGSGRSYELKELLEYIVSLSEVKIDIEVDEALLRPSDNPIICCNHDKLTRELGWQPEYTIFDAIDEVYASYLG